jgi:hypothetical protein
MSVRGKAIFFETQWAVKTLVFLGKIFATCKPEGWAKSVQKEGAIEILIPPTSCNPGQQKSRVFSSEAVFSFDTPPSLILLGSYLCNWDFLAWDWNYHAVDINMGQGRSVQTSRIFCLDQW